LPRRNFGGVGLMIERPGLQVSAEFLGDCDREADDVQGPFASRAKSFLESYRANTGMFSAVRLRIESEALEHTGLGVGTQLGLAVLTAIDGKELRTEILARFVDRGHRSAIGVYGFEMGGFLVEGGRTLDRDFAPLLVRYDFPEDWHILLATSRGIQGTHGRPEVDAFAALTNHEREDQITEKLCRLVLLGMLPALASVDMAAFGEAVYDFNRRVGETFRPIQGGVYAHPRVEEIVKILRGAGVKGVGQSSWGPTVFAIVAREQAQEMRDWIARDQDLDVIVTSACNHGAIVSA
jgi:beta-RFAP synthase